MYVSISIDEIESMQRVTATQIHTLLLEQYGEDEVDPISKTEFMGFHVNTYRNQYYPVWQVYPAQGESSKAYAVEGVMNGDGELVEVFFQ